MRVDRNIVGIPFTDFITSPFLDFSHSLIYYIIILIYNKFMATISVPLSPQLQENLDALVASGAGANRADVMRRALELFAREEAINVVLKAQREPALRGNLRELLKKVK
jgi:Arc/MetJ-type ribon-helix-helix transcriptional regulator